ncbi:unnamed protein product [Mesocestoides corti]|nr:unnamed protein product [Mesocestoides corti]
MRGGWVLRSCTRLSFPVSQSLRLSAGAPVGGVALTPPGPRGLRSALRGASPVWMLTFNCYFADRNFVLSTVITLQADRLSAAPGSNSIQSLVCSLHK